MAEATSTKENYSPKVILLINGPKYSGKDTFGVLFNMMAFSKNAFTCKRFAFADKLKEETAETYAESGISAENFADDQKEVPLLHKPVIGHDSYSKIIQKELVDHFRTENGEKPYQRKMYYPSDFGFDDVPQFAFTLLDKMTSTLPISTRTLYWTPRALLIHEGFSKRAFDGDFWVDRCKKEIMAYAIKNGGPEVVYITDYRLRNEKSRCASLFSTSEVITIKIAGCVPRQAFDASEADLMRSKFNFEIDNSRVFKKKIGDEGWKEEWEPLLKQIREIVDRIRSLVDSTK